MVLIFLSTGHWWTPSMTSNSSQCNSSTMYSRHSHRYSRCWKKPESAIRKCPCWTACRWFSIKWAKNCPMMRKACAIICQCYGMKVMIIICFDVQFYRHWWVFKHGSFIRAKPVSSLNLSPWQLQVIIAISEIPPFLSPFLYPVISMSTNQNEPSHIYFLEDALELWLAVVQNSTVLTPELLSLTGNLLPIIGKARESYESCSFFTGNRDFTNLKC